MTHLYNLIAFLIPSVLAGSVPKTCKAYPGSSDWPSHKAWSRLNDTLDGRLFAPVPPGAICHKGWPSYDKDTCPKVAEAWKHYDFHTQDPVSLIYDQYSNWTCLPDEKYPCSGRGYPAYVVNVTKAEHVKAGVDFARRNNIRLVVKNTGHDYMGRSIAPGSLSLWTRHLNDITYHKGSFKLYNSKTVITGDAVTAGAGTQMYDLYTMLDKYGRVIVGGGGKTVGVGGYVTGGGHSILSTKYGLAVDQVLQMTMVTPSGNILTINEDNHPDLFWAMRGGGGSTFGVLTSITMKVYKTPKITASSFTIGTTAAAPFKYDLLAYILSQFPSLSAAGISGYTSLSPQTRNPAGGSDEVAGIQGLFAAQDVDDPEYILKLFKPINDTIQKRWPGAVLFIATQEEYGSFLECFDVYFDKGAAGVSLYLTSRLLGKEALGDEKEFRVALEESLVAAGGLTVHLIAGKGVRDAKPRGGSAAVNPGWRKSYIQAISGESFEPFNKTSKAEAIKTLNRSMEPFRKLSPDTGSYINEALPFEPDWQHAFWGNNYERLLSIKRNVDPDDVLWCFPCVGSERWQQKDDGHLCRVK